MKEKTASITAEEMAGYRALEMLLPEEERVCEDPFAKHFLNEQWERGFKYPLLGKFFTFVGNLMAPGATEAVVARARFIDEYIKTCKQKGLEQLVILGAGYDCRPYRLEELKKGVIVFDVDHPATQEKKRDKLSGIFDALPENVVFVPCRFDKQGLGEKLTEMGYDKTKKSLFIMEGLIMYLPKETIEALFLFISHNSGPGSSIIFDFLPPGIEDGTITIRGGKNMNKWAKKRGEPFQFGIAKEKLPGFLAKTGFNNVNSIAAEECREKYFKGASRKRTISGLFSFAHATVSPELLNKNQT